MRKILTSLLGLVFLIAPTFAQTIEVTGKVTDDTGSPIPNASIKVKGSKAGTSAGSDGTFKISVSSKAILVISAVGYEPIEVTASPSINVTLKQDKQELTEVVVTGVAQATSRKNLSFSLTKVKGGDINIVPQLDASQSLRGRVAGIQINQSQGNQGATVFLRGAKSIFGNIPPLIVIDGFQTNLTLSDLNPEDIEGIEVVKGAAASSLYGTRAEGGVIQVITKKGKTAKGRPNIVVDGEYGFNNIQRTPELSRFHPYKINPDGSFVLNGTQRDLNYAPNGFSLVLSPYQKYFDNTKALLNNRPFQNYVVSVANTTGPFNYYVSFQNQHRGGAVKVVDPDIRNTFKLNVGYKPWEKVETNITFQYIENQRPSDFLSRDNQGTLFAATLQYEPFIDLTERDQDGNYKAEPTGFEIQNANLYNPLYEWDRREVTSKATDVLIGADFRWKFVKNFEFFVSGAVNNNNNNRTNYYPRGYETVNANPVLNNGYYGITNVINSFKNFNAQINYSSQYRDFDFGASLKTIYEEVHYDRNDAAGSNLSSPLKSLTITDPATRSQSTDFAQTINYGYFANFRVGWKSKVFFDALGRLDRSSRYGKNVENAFFPRASIAYRLSEDVKIKSINELKFRVAWGRAGSLPPYDAKNGRATPSSNGVSITQLENPNLERSYTDEIEAGVDGQAFGRLNFNITYANASSKKDFIQTPPLVPLTGRAYIWRNLGAVKSSSIEAELNADVLRKKNITVNVGLTFTRVRSEITDLGGVPEFATPSEVNGSNVFWKAEGLSANAFWGEKFFRSLEELQAGSDGKIINAVGGAGLTLSDYTVNSLGFVVEKSKLGTTDERPIRYLNPATGNTTFLGRGEPDFQIGLPVNITLFSKLNIFFLIDWKQGGYKYNQTKQYLTFDSRTKVWEDFLRAGLPIQFLQTVYNGNSITDYWLEKNSFVAFRELSLSYNLSGDKLKKVGKTVKNIRFALVGRNLFYITNYEGVNPEGYWEYYPYPVYRTLSAKLTVNLF